MWILPNKKSKLAPRTVQQQQLFLQMELRKKECRLRYHTRTVQGGNDSPPPPFARGILFGTELSSPPPGSERVHLYRLFHLVLILSSQAGRGLGQKEGV